MKMDIKMTCTTRSMEINTLTLNNNNNLFNNKRKHNTRSMLISTVFHFKTHRTLYTNATRVNQQYRSKVLISRKPRI